MPAPARYSTAQFADGLKHGKGRTRLAGGTVYESQWEKGKEIGGTRPDVLADARVGGLLKAQAGGGDADKVEIGIAVDQRMTQQADMQYQHLVRDEDIAIYPVADEMNAAWNGTGEITTYSAVFDGMDWENAPAFAEVDVGTTDGSRVKLDRLEMQVPGQRSLSQADAVAERALGLRRLPAVFLVQEQWLGRRARMPRSRSSSPARSPATTPTRRAAASPRTIGSFGNGADVFIEDVLAEAGVDTQKLASERFSCQSMDSINVCKSQVFNTVGFGEVADFVWGDQKLMTTAKGTLTTAGPTTMAMSTRRAEPFRVDISLAVIEVPEELAECGDGFGGSPEALRYQDVELPIGQRDYVRRPADARQQELSQLHGAAENVVGDVVVPPIPGGREICRRQRAALEDGKPVLLPPETIRLVSTADPGACYLSRTREAAEICPESAGAPRKLAAVGAIPPSSRQVGSE